MSEKICGIYCIENKINGKKYIGQSINIKARWSAHKKDLNNYDYTKENCHFVNAWKKYGADNFDFYIIEQCEVALLNEREKYWISIYNTTNKYYGYNRTLGGNSYSMELYSEEKKKEIHEKRSAILKLTTPKGENSSCAKLTEKQVLDIIKLFQNGDYDSNIARKFNISGTVIHDIRNRKIWTSVTKNYEWDKTPNTSERNNSHCVDMYTLDGIYLQTFKSISEASRYTNINKECISSVCRGNNKTGGGYVWRYQGHPFNEYITKSKHLKAVDQYDMDWNYITTYSTIKEAQLATGLNHISHCIRGKCKYAGNYRWLYHNEQPPVRDKMK